MDEEPLRVLLVDDEWSLREPLAKYLAGPPCHFHVDPAADAGEALDRVARAERPYDVALIDDLLSSEPEAEPEPIGIDLMRQIRAHSPATECIVFTGWGMDRALEALRAGAYRYLAKPADRGELGVTIRMAAEHSWLRRERDLLDAALEVSRALTRGLDVEKKLEIIAETVPQLTGAEACAVAWMDPATHQVRYEPVIPLGAAEVRWYRHLRRADLTRRIIETGESFTISDVNTCLDDVDEALCQAGVRSFIGVPIPGERQNRGVLYAYSTRPEAFPAHEKRVLQLLASQAGVAIANAQAFQQTHTHADYMEALVRVGQGLTKAASLQDRLNLVWEFVQEQLHISTFFVALYDEATDTASFPLFRDEGKIIPIEDELLGDDRASWGITGYVVKTDRELYWPDEKEKASKCASLGIRPIRVGKPCQSCFCLPLKTGDRVIGALSIQSYDPHAFSPILLDACRALASQLSVALESARLFSELAEAKEWREALIENAFDAVIAIDQEARITVFNRQAEEMFGWTASDMIGKSVARLHVDFEKAREILETVNSRGAISNWNVALKHRNGTTFPALLSATLIRDSQGQPIGQAGFVRDLRRMVLLEGRLRALIEVSKAITSTLNVDEVLQLVMASAVAAFPAADGGSIHLYDERTDSLCMRANTFDYSAAAIEASCLSPGEGIAGWVFQQRQAAVVDDVRQSPQYVRIDHPEAPDHKSIICVPLEVRERVIGTLCLDNLRAVGAFRAGDVGLLSTFADQAAIAIDNARRMEELEQMRQVAEALSGVVEPRQALQKIVESACEVLRADSAAIWSYDEVRDRFIPGELTAKGIPPELLERMRREEPKPGRTAYTVMAQGYVSVTDISRSEYKFLGDSTRESLSLVNVQSFQGIALQVGQDRLGVLYVNYHRTRTFDDEAKATLQTFAGHAALALKNARLLDQVKKARDAARVVAQVSTLGDLSQTLASITKGTQETLLCDAVTLYTYDQEQDKLDFPPAMEGVKEPEKVRKLGLVREASVVRNILALDKAYEAEDAVSDPLMRGPFVVREGIKSSVGIPLKVEDHKVGVMFVNYRSRHRFTNDELTNIGLFANQAAVAIRNAQLYRKSQERAAMLESLYKAAQAVPGSLSLLDVLQQIAEQAWQLAEPSGEKQAQLSHVALREGNTLTFVAGYAPEHLEDLQAKVGDINLEPGQEGRVGIAGRAVRTARAQRVGNVLADPDYIQYDEKTRSELAVPLMMGGQAIGVVNVEHLEYNAFDEEDEMALELLAGQAVIAIQNARQNELQRAVYEASKAISERITSEQRDLLNRILQQAVTRICWPRKPKAALGIIQLCDQETRELCLESVYPPEEYPRLVDRLGERRSLDRPSTPERIGVGGRTVLEARPQRVPDVRTDQDYVELWPGTLSELDVPLRLGDRILGVLGLESERLAAFDEADERALQSLADLAAIVIENARQYGELRQAKGLVGARTALAWMGMTASAWRHAIDKHALTIQEQTELLRRDLDEVPMHEPRPQLAQRLSMLERLAGQILEKPIVPPLSREESTEPVVVNELIGERARQLWQNGPYKAAELQLDLKLSSAATVRTSPEWLRRAFDILVDNAVDAVLGQKVRAITISTRQTGGRAEVLVSDTGPGIPEEIKAKVGLEMIEKPEDARGLGMGLLMAQTIVQTYGGEIRLGSTGPTGTTMVLRLPLEK
jgi:PAS domain S-box-containing protein